MTGEDHAGGQVSPECAGPFGLHEVSCLLFYAFEGIHHDGGFRGQDRRKLGQLVDGGAPQAAEADNYNVVRR